MFSSPQNPNPARPVQQVRPIHRHRIKRASIFCLDILNYVAFGSGNNTYEHYNSKVRNVNKALESSVPIVSEGRASILLSPCNSWKRLTSNWNYSGLNIVLNLLAGEDNLENTRGMSVFDYN
ncbi:hypothetical protein V8F33_002632 [Rhypophila sp. PSN 637]